jgi:hypothetical protein
MHSLTLSVVVALLLVGQASTRADEVAELKAKLEAANARIESLEKQLAELKPDQHEKPIVGPLGSSWKGKTIDQKGVTAVAEWTVIAREDGKITFKTTSELGNIWEYDAEFLKATPKNFKIIDARRIKAADGNTNPTLVGAVSGTGSIIGDKLSVRTTWNNAKMVLEFKGNLKDAEHAKK